MEELQQLLKSYSCNSCVNFLEEWGLQFCEQPFPKYWHVVYGILKDLSKEMTVVEIGSGYGDVISIPVSLGFSKVYGFERRKELCDLANDKLRILFGRRNVIKRFDFNNIEVQADILVMVNCVYADNCKSKKDYLNKVRGYYDNAHQPKIFMYEAIDETYNIWDETYPAFVRLNIDDIRQTFPNTSIKAIETSIYPCNRRSKTLYIIKRNEDNDCN